MIQSRVGAPFRVLGQLGVVRRAGGGLSREGREGKEDKSWQRRMWDALKDKSEDGAGCICGAKVAGRPENPVPTNKAFPSHGTSSKKCFVRVFTVDVKIHNSFTFTKVAVASLQRSLDSPCCCGPCPCSRHLPVSPRLIPVKTQPSTTNETV